MSEYGALPGARPDGTIGAQGREPTGFELWVGDVQKGFTSMDSGTVEQMSHSTIDLAFGSSEPKETSTGYMSKGNVGASMAKGAVSGYAKSPDPVTGTAMAIVGATIGGLSTYLGNKKAEEYNAALAKMREKTIEADTKLNIASSEQQYGQKKASAMQNLTYSMNKAILG